MKRGRNIKTKAPITDNDKIGNLFVPEETKSKLKIPETVSIPKAGDEPTTEPHKIELPKEEPKASIFEEMEKRDEEQIQLIEGGVVVDEPFYALTTIPDPEFPEEEKMVYGISFAGTMSLARAQKNLKVVGQPFPEHTDKEYNYTVTVEDTTRNVSTYGSSSEPKFFKAKNGSTIMYNGQPKANQFARIICLSKAQRNAFRKLLEGERVEGAFKEWYKRKYGEEANMGKVIVVSEYTKLDAFKSPK